MTHPLALFSLVPLNDRAREVLDSPRNKHFVSTTDEGNKCLDIGHIRSKSGNATTLAILGRNGDIIIEGSSISKEQCSFELNLKTGVVMFYDRSHSQTSQVFGFPGVEAKPFEYDRPRKVVVCSRVNPCIGFGGARRDQYQFRLDWTEGLRETMTTVKNREGLVLQENASLAETVDESETAWPSRMETRVHNTAPRQLKVRWTSVGSLGAGEFGDVHKAVDVDHGTLMAVKILKPSKRGVNPEMLKTYWRREVKILAKMKHSNIVECFASQGWDGDVVEIFMALQDGSLVSLMQPETKRLMTTDGIIKLTCHHILQAIDYLETWKIVHRDIKPDNILYTEQEGRYHFRLGDFGLSNHQSVAVTGACGSNEFFLNISADPNPTEDTYKTIWAIGANENHVANMREMGALNPEDRASAAQMLVKCYGGEGLSTPLRQVPLLSQPFASVAQAPVAACQAALPIAYPAYPDMTCPGLVDYPVLLEGYPGPFIGYEALPMGDLGLPMCDQGFPIGDLTLPIEDQAFLIGNQALPIGDQVTDIGFEAFPVGDLALPIDNQAFLIDDKTLPMRDQAPPLAYYDSQAVYKATGRVHEGQALIRRDTAIAHDIQAMPNPVAPPQLGPRRATHPFLGTEQDESPSQ
ncbi:hypothetical protein FHL15_006957 [Xylaria flabelliformis]|uniref:mitogen-activated protein kinase n=1 Tax=Xylaria flabelliformis TaxID=2512241 RepID=A0A553HVW8_9PEZI|nr:hypothetical protein FHL15_006957 [Xylaria flabelliformis]